MKLRLKRNQKENRGLMGGYKGMTFILSCQVDLTAEERALVSKYKMEQHPLTYRTINGTQVPWLTISGLLAGTSQEIADVTTLLSNEEVIKNACRDFKVLPEVMASFGGEEVIDFDMPQLMAGASVA